MKIERQVWLFFLVFEVIPAWLRALQREAEELTASVLAGILHLDILCGHGLSMPTLAYTYTCDGLLVPDLGLLAPVHQGDTKGDTTGQGFWLLQSGTLCWRVKGSLPCIVQRSQAGPPDILGLGSPNQPTVRKLEK